MEEDPPGGVEFLIHEIIVGRCKCATRSKKKWRRSYANGEQMDVWKLVLYFLLDEANEASPWNKCHPSLNALTFEPS